MSEALFTPLTPIQSQAQIPLPLLPSFPSPLPEPAIELLLKYLPRADATQKGNEQPDLKNPILTPPFQLVGIRKDYDSKMMRAERGRWQTLVLPASLRFQTKADSAKRYLRLVMDRAIATLGEATRFDVDLYRDDAALQRAVGPQRQTIGTPRSQALREVIGDGSGDSCAFRQYIKRLVIGYDVQNGLDYPDLQENKHPMLINHARFPNLEILVPFGSLLTTGNWEGNVQEQWPKLRKFLFKGDHNATWDSPREVPYYRFNLMSPLTVRYILNGSRDLQEAAFQLTPLETVLKMAHPKLETLFLSSPANDDDRTSVDFPSLRQLHIERFRIQFLDAKSSANIRECTLNDDRLDLEILKVMPALELLRIPVVTNQEVFVKALVEWLSDRSKWGIECPLLRTIRIEGKVGTWKVEEGQGSELIPELLQERVEFAKR